MSFSVSTPFHFCGMYQRRAMPFSLFPPIIYSQASDYSVTVGVVNTIFLSEILSLQPIGGFLSRAVGTICASNGDIVGVTSLLSLESFVVDSGSNFLVL